MPTKWDIATGRRWPPAEKQEAQQHGNPSAVGASGNMNQRNVQGKLERRPGPLSKGRARGGIASLHVGRIFSYVMSHVPVRYRPKGEIPPWFAELYGVPRSWLRTKITSLSRSQRLLTSCVRLAWTERYLSKQATPRPVAPEEPHLPPPKVDWGSIFPRGPRGDRPNRSGVASILRVLARRILGSTLTLRPCKPINWVATVERSAPAALSGLPSAYARYLAMLQDNATS